MCKLFDPFGEGNNFYSVESFDGGYTWEDYDALLLDYWGYDFTLVPETSIVLASTWGNGVLKMTDYGWEPAGEGIPEGAAAGDMEFTPLGDILVDIWGAGIYASLDSGATWEPDNEGLTSSGSLGKDSEVTESGVMTVAGTYGGNFLRTTSSAPMITTIPSDTLDFGDVYIGYPDTGTVTIRNSGLSPLEVYSVELTGDGFSLVNPPADTITLDFWETFDLDIAFDPALDGNYLGEITILSNSVENDTLVIEVIATALFPPEISVSPDSLWADLFTGETETQTLTIANTGESDLVYQLEVESVEGLRNTSSLAGNPPLNRQPVNIRELLGISSSVRSLRSHRADVAGRERISSRSVGSRDWSLLYTDPDDDSLTYDVGNVYGMSNGIDIAVKFESYEGWGNPYEIGMGVIVIVDADQNTETGYYVGEWDVGADFVVNGSEFFEMDMGLYAVIDDGDIEWLSPLTIFELEANSNFITVGVSAADMGDPEAIDFYAWVGALYVEDLDYVPDIYSGHISWELGPGWLELSSEGGTIPAGGQDEIIVTFDASGLFGGDYFADIIVSSNDPTDPEITVPAHLDVTGAPDIAVSADTLDFGEVFINYSDTLELIVENDGTDDLLISAVVAEPSEYSVSASSAEIVPGAMETFLVTFSSGSVGDYPGTLTFSSNDPDEGTYIVILEGQCVEPPIISVSPDSLNDSLFTGEISTQLLSISNSGGSDLIWEIDIEGVGLGTVTFTKDDYADWTLPENQDRITDNVWITRANSQGIFNIATESYYNWDSPHDTEWSYGYTEDLEPEDYQVWRDAVGGYPPGMVDEPMSLHLISDDLYFDVIFHSWTSGGQGGGFSYTRTDVEPPWLEVSELSGIVPADSSMEIGVTFDAAGLFGGDYEASIMISNNDPVDPLVTVPVNMNVTGAPDIWVDQDSLDFGETYVDYGGTLELLIGNNGTDVLEVTSITSDNDVFTISQSSATIDYGEEIVVEVSFLPTAVGDYSGTITLLSDDSDEGTVEILVSGSAVEPPIISLSPDSLYSALFTGEVDSQVVTISNSGGSDLDFILSIEAVDQARTALGLNHTVINAGSRPSSVERLTSRGSISERINHTDFVSSSRRTTGVNVLLVLADDDIYYGSPFAEHLLTYEDISVVDIYDAGVSTPDLETLQSYDVVVPWSNYSYWDAVALGNILAEYVDSGGALVMFQFCFSNVSGMDGQIMTEGYAPFDNAYVTYEEKYLGDYDADHPIMDGVSEGYDGYSSAVSLVGDPEVVAWYDDGTPCVAVNPNVVGVNVYVGTYYWADSDFFHMGHNAVIYAATGGVDWLAANPIEGTVPAGESLDVMITFDAAGMFGGDYFADIIVTNNDPANPEVSIPAHLNVTGAPDIWVDPDTMDFGETYVDYGGTLELLIGNDGTDVLDVTSISSDNDVFTISQSSATIDYGEELVVDVSFLPTSVGDYSGIITILSNDSDEGTVEILVSGSAIEPPIISVTPDSLYEALYTGEVATQIVTISNNGGSDLEWEIGISSSDILNGLSQLSIISKDALRLSVRSELDHMKPTSIDQRKDPEPLNLQIVGYLAENHDSPTTRSNDKKADSHSRITARKRIVVHSGDRERSGGRQESLIAIMCDFGYDGGDELPNTLTDFGYDYVYVWSVSEAEAEGADAIISGYGASCDWYEITGWIESGKGYIQNGDWYNWFPNGYEWTGSEPIEVELLDGSHPIANDLPASWTANGFWHYSGGGYIGWVTDDIFSNVGQGTVWGSTYDRVITADQVGDGYAVYLGFNVFGSEAGEESLQLFANALQYVTTGGVASWLSLDQESGVLPIGESIEVEVAFDAAGLFGGDYFADIVVSSNDPAYPEVRIPVNLNVTGVPDIAITDEVVDFDISYVGYMDLAHLSIDNEGTDDLVISDVQSGNPELTVTPASLTIPPMSSDTLSLVLLSYTEGEFSTAVTLTSNDPDESTVEVPVVSTVFIAPDIVVSPEAFDLTVPSGEMASDSIIITNDGGSDLDWSIEIEYADGLAMRESQILGDLEFDAPYPPQIGSGAQHVENSGEPHQSSLTLDDLRSQRGSIDLLAWVGCADYYQEYLNTLDAINMYFTDYTLYESYAESADDLVSDLEGIDVLLFPEQEYCYMYYYGEAWSDVLTGFVEQGGTVIVCADYEYLLDGWGLMVHGYYNWIDAYYNLQVIEPDHPLAEGLDASFSAWDATITFPEWVTEGVANIVEETDYGIGNVFSIYSYGNGQVIYHGADFYVYEENTAQMIANAVTFGGQNWLSAEPMVGTISAGESSTITVIFDAADLEAGDYSAEIVINSNDPDDETVTIPVLLTVTGAGIDNQVALPEKYALHQNYPNPFNPVTTIRYDLPEVADVRLTVYDLLGREVLRLVDERQEAGYQSVIWNGRDMLGREVATGVYIYRLTAGDFVMTRKLVLMK
ncbi:MAG: choice-of-anchor D domain-containing protein [Fidelibacterota bacterium]